MRSLSDLQIGHIQRRLQQVLDFVQGPSPTGSPDGVPQWCRQVCGVDTLREVVERWAKCVKDLGDTLFTVGLAEKVRKDRPATPGNLLLIDLNTCEEYAHAILCLAVDLAEGDEIFRRARQGIEVPFGE